MADSKPRRKTRSDKFPLTLHPTGQYCKKVKGKLYYFGTDKKKALQRYLDQAAYLHRGRGLKHHSEKDAITIKTLCNLYLDFQESRVQAGELTVRHNVDQVKTLRTLVRFLGQHRLVGEISTLDLQNFKRRLQKAYGSAHRINLHIAIMKAMFHWAKKNEVLETIPNIDAVSKAKVVRQEKPTFTVDQIRKLLDEASVQMRAMILLGLNCGFGCTDCSGLQWKHVDFNTSRVLYPRGKTGVNRNLPLWQETISALNAIPRSSERVFNTPTGKAWVRMIRSVDKAGNVKFTNNDSVGKEFSKLIKKVGIQSKRVWGSTRCARQRQRWLHNQVTRLRSKITRPCRPQNGHYLRPGCIEADRPSDKQHAHAHP